MLPGYKGLIFYSVSYPGKPIPLSSKRLSIFHEAGTVILLGIQTKIPIPHSLHSNGRRQVINNSNNQYLMLGDKCCRKRTKLSQLKRIKHTEGVIMNFKQGGQDRLPKDCDN